MTIFITSAVLLLELNIKKYLILLFTLFFLVLLVFFQNKLNNNRIFHNITNPLSISSMQARLPIYNAGWSCFVDKPVLGYGFTNFEACFNSQRKMMLKKYKIVEKRVSDAHNLFLQFLSETGILGFLIMIYIISKGFYNSFQKFRLAFYLMVALVLYFMLNMNLYLRETSTVFFLLVGMSVTLFDETFLVKEE